MREDVKKIMRVLPENASVAEAVEFLLDRRLMSSTAPRDAEIVYKLRENRKESGRARGVIATSCQTGVSDRTIYRVIGKWGD